MKMSRPLAVSLISCLAIAACGGSDSSTYGNSAPKPAQGPATSPTPTPGSVSAAPTQAPAPSLVVTSTPAPVAASAPSLAPVAAPAPSPAPVAAPAPGPTATPTPTPAPTPASAPNPLLTRRIKVWCVGDSLTTGQELTPNGFRSYRGRLYLQLIAAGYDVEFVGSQFQTPAVGGDPDHDSYGNALLGPGGTPNIYDRLPALMSSADPDIVVLAMGWASAYIETELAGGKYRGLAELILQLKPSVHLVVATLTPARGETEAQTSDDVQGYRDVNAAARQLAAASTTGKVHLADLAPLQLDAAQYWDVIHLFQPNADLMAGVLFNTIVNGPLRRP
jgi:hypothetical protein